MFEPITLIVATAICLPAVIMASRRSPWMIDYLFFVVALNRGIRRIVDYQNGAFNPTSLISLTPIIVGGLAALVVLLELNERSNRFGTKSFVVICCYGIAISMAFVVGIINFRLGAVYALGDFIAPIGLLGFGAVYSNRPDIIDRWCQSMALSAVVVAAYGIWQFYTIPAWDAFWVKEVNFEGYLGQLKPTKMTLFSTMNERGPAASYLCAGLILLLLRPGTLSWLRWPAISMVLMAMMLTYVRTSLIQTALAYMLFPVINRGSGFVSVAVLCVVIGLFGGRIIDGMPGSGMVSKRVNSISTIHKDGSLKGRMMLLEISLRESNAVPQGLGLGSHGMSMRIQNSSKRGVMDSSGYTETLLTLGWVGFVLIVFVLFQCWKSSSRLVGLGMKDENVSLFRAWFVSGMIALFAGNWLFAASFFGC
jgi:putative inorganic carbon (HCO3(-)) transporter